MVNLALRWATGRWPFTVLGERPRSAVIFPWGHGIWRGELETAREEWDLKTIDPAAPEFIHVHQVVRAQHNDQVGWGILESLILGSHKRSGLEGLFDGAKS